MVEAIRKELIEVRVQLEDIKRDYLRWAHRTFVIMCCLVFTTALGGAITYRLWQQNKERVQDIERSRKTLLYQSCLEQNVRNIHTHEFVSTAVVFDSQSKTQILAIVDKIIPYKDCKRLVSIKLGRD